MCLLITVWDIDLAGRVSLSVATSGCNYLHVTFIWLQFDSDVFPALSDIYVN